MPLSLPGAVGLHLGRRRSVSCLLVLVERQSSRSLVSDIFKRVLSSHPVGKAPPSRLLKHSRHMHRAPVAIGGKLLQLASEARNFGWLTRCAENCGGDIREDGLRGANIFRGQDLRSA